MRIAFLSIPVEELEKNFVADDGLMIEPLRSLGHTAEFVPWKSEVDWRQFDGVVIRTTWDYQNDLSAFLRVLEQIETQTRLANPFEIAKWNADKSRYLRDLEKQGTRIVPTILGDSSIDSGQVQQWCDQLQADEIVIKPSVGANAQDTFRIKRSADDVDGWAGVFKNRSYMVQPFMDEIVNEGEYSLFYFNGLYSHAVLKTPNAEDFRVQEEHGATIQPVVAPEALPLMGEKILKQISPTPLYARVDFVRTGDEFAVMELELIEPSMYLRTAEHAPQLFAKAIDRWLS
ncbi:MAG TPA: hypothetical protein VJU84_20020 [Pyrinomonadaceae bacterium]|nr:hypothetical protein [Pyrinomonadaceae bacterium]